MKNKPKRYIAIFQYYIDCPTCDGLSDYNKYYKFNTIKEIVDKVLELYGQAQCVNIISTIKDHEEDYFDVPSYYCSGHQVKELTWNIRWLKFKLFKKDGKRILLPDNESSHLLYKK